MRVCKNSSTTTGEESPFGISIVDGGTGKYIDVLEVVMELACPKSHLPEIFSIFGRGELLKFLDVFAGTTIRIPSRDVLERCMRDVVIYLALVRVLVPHRNREIKALANRYKTTSGDIRATFVKIEKAFHGQKLIV